MIYGASRKLHWPVHRAGTMCILTVLTPAYTEQQYYHDISILLIYNMDNQLY